MRVIATRYTKSVGLHRGGKPGNPRELTEVSDWGKRTQPTRRQHE
ncbi:MAG TPA: addiction module toxin RelE [Raoultella sp.]|nr:addiction module toxin RelE [Raoultella sp.]